MNSNVDNLTSVLVVDDDASVLDYMTRLLNRCGYAAIPAASRSEALALMATKEPERAPGLAIVDVILGQDSGVELADALLARWPQLRVLLVSGYIDNLVNASEQRARVFFLPKMFSPDQLIRALQAMASA